MQSLLLLSILFSNPWLVVIFVVMFIILVIHAATSGSKSKKRQGGMTKMTNMYDRPDALYSSSTKKVKQYVSDFEAAYKEAEPHMTSSQRSAYREIKSEITQTAREQIRELEEDRWERVAEKHLQNFYDSYYMVTNGELHTFRDVELLMKEKARCIREWQSYFAVDLDQFDTTIYPKKYMREYLGEDYDPCMDSHEALEKKLSDCVASMRPEQKRKNQLYKLIVDHVRRQETVPRGELLKTEFPGYIPEEVRCCYRELIKRNRLVETKMGNRFFVSLSDKELAKKALPVKQPAEAVPPGTGQAPEPPTQTDEPAPESYAPDGPDATLDFVGETIAGNGWKILFDGETDRTRVMFDTEPTDAALAAVEDAGFYYSQNMNSYNKKLTKKAHRAALTLADRLRELYDTETKQ